MNNQTYKITIEKIVWIFAPIIYGAFVWFMGWGLGASLIPFPSLNYLTQIVLAVIVVNYFFGSALHYAARAYKPQFFGYPFPLPSWHFFALLTIVAACINLTPLSQFDLVSSLIRGVIVSAILEELIARSFFVKYAMGLKEFIALNIASSLAFMLMHSFYVKDGMALNQLLQNGHFGFSFMLGIIVYKTGRIELSILLHMLSNLLRYTAPVCLLDCPWPSNIAIAFSMLVDVVSLLCLAGCSSSKRK